MTGGTAIGRRIQNQIAWPSTPQYSSNGDLDSGVGFPAANGVSAGGVEVARFVTTAAAGSILQSMRKGGHFRPRGIFTDGNVLINGKKRPHPSDPTPARQKTVTERLADPGMGRPILPANGNPPVIHDRTAVDVAQAPETFFQERCRFIEVLVTKAQEGRGIRLPRFRDSLPSQ